MSVRLGTLSVLLPGKSHGQRSLEGCSPWGCEESDTTERLHFHFSLSCLGERNGNPLQCSCLENPREGGAWWAAVYGVAQSQTRLKRLSSSILILMITVHIFTYIYIYIHIYIRSAVLSHSVMSSFCNPMDCSPPCSSVHGNFPGRNTRMGCYALLQAIFPTQ